MPIVNANKRIPSLLPNMQNSPEEDIPKEENYTSSLDGSPTSDSNKKMVNISSIKNFAISKSSMGSCGFRDFLVNNYDAVVVEQSGDDSVISGLESRCNAFLADIPLCEIPAHESVVGKISLSDMESGIMVASSFESQAQRIVSVIKKKAELGFSGIVLSNFLWIIESFNHVYLENLLRKILELLRQEMGSDFQTPEEGSPSSPRMRGANVTVKSFLVVIDWGDILSLPKIIKPLFLSLRTEVHAFLLRGVTLCPDLGHARLHCQVSEKCGHLFSELESEMQERSDFAVWAADMVSNRSSVLPTNPIRFARFCDVHNVVGLFLAGDRAKVETFEVNVICREVDVSPLGLLKSDLYQKFRMHYTKAPDHVENFLIMSGKAVAKNDAKDSDLLSETSSVLPEEHIVLEFDNLLPLMNLLSKAHDVQGSDYVDHIASLSTNSVSIEGEISENQFFDLVSSIIGQCGAFYEQDLHRELFDVRDFDRYDVELSKLGILAILKDCESRNSMDDDIDTVLAVLPDHAPENENSNEEDDKDEETPNRKLQCSSVVVKLPGLIDILTDLEDRTAVTEFFVTPTQSGVPQFESDHDKEEYKTEMIKMKEAETIAKNLLGLGRVGNPRARLLRMGRRQSSTLNVFQAPEIELLGQKEFGYHHRIFHFQEIVRRLTEMRDGGLLMNLSLKKEQEMFSGNSEKNEVITVDDERLSSAIERIQAVSQGPDRSISFASTNQRMESDVRGLRSKEIMEAFGNRRAALNNIYSSSPMSPSSGGLPTKALTSNPMTTSGPIMQALATLVEEMTEVHPNSPNFMKVQVWLCNEQGLRSMDFDGAFLRYFAVSDVDFNGVFHIYVSKAHPNIAEAIVHQYFQKQGYNNTQCVILESLVSRNLKVLQPFFDQDLDRLSVGREFNSSQSVMLDLLSDRMVSQVESATFLELLGFIQRQKKHQRSLLSRSDITTLQKNLAVRISLQVSSLATDTLLSSSVQNVKMANEAALLSQPLYPVTYSSDSSNGNLLFKLVREAAWNPHSRIVFDILMQMSALECEILKSRGKGTTYLAETVAWVGRDAGLEYLSLAIRDTILEVIREPDLCTVHVEMNGHGDTEMIKSFGLNRHEVGHILAKRIRWEIRDEIRYEMKKNVEIKDGQEEKPKKIAINASFSASNNFTVQAKEEEEETQTDDQLNKEGQKPDEILSPRTYIAKFFDGLYFMVPFVANLILIFFFGAGLYSSIYMTQEQQFVAGIGLILGFLGTGGYNWMLSQIGGMYYFQWSFSALYVTFMRFYLAGVLALALLSLICYIIAAFFLDPLTALLLPAFSILLGSIQLEISCLFNMRTGSIWTSAGGIVILVMMAIGNVLVFVLLFVAKISAVASHLISLLFVSVVLFVSWVFIAIRNMDMYEGIRAVESQEMLDWYHRIGKGPLPPRKKADDQEIASWWSDQCTPDFKETHSDQTVWVKVAKAALFRLRRDSRAEYAKQVCKLASSIAPIRFFRIAFGKYDKFVVKRARMYHCEESLITWYLLLTGKDKPPAYSDNYDIILGEAVKTMTIKRKTDYVHRFGIIWNHVKGFLLQGFLYFGLLFVDRITRLFFLNEQAFFVPFNSTYEVSLGWAQVFLLLGVGSLEPVLYRRSHLLQQLGGGSRKVNPSNKNTFNNLRKYGSAVSSRWYRRELAITLFVCIMAFAVTMGAMMFSFGNVKYDEFILMGVGAFGYLGFLIGSLNRIAQPDSESNKRLTKAMGLGVIVGIVSGAALIILARVGILNYAVFGFERSTSEDLSIVGLLLGCWTYAIVARPKYWTETNVLLSSQAPLMTTDMQTSGQKWISSGGSSEDVDAVKKERMLIGRKLLSTLGSCSALVGVSSSSDLGVGIAEFLSRTQERINSLPVDCLIRKAFPRSDVFFSTIIKAWNNGYIKVYTVPQRYLRIQTTLGDREFLSALSGRISNVEEDADARIKDNLEKLDDLEEDNIRIFVALEGKEGKEQQIRRISEAIVHELAEQSFGVAHRYAVAAELLLSTTDDGNTPRLPDRITAELNNLSKSALYQISDNTDQKILFTSLINLKFDQIDRYWSGLSTNTKAFVLGLVQCLNPEPGAEILKYLRHRIFMRMPASSYWSAVIELTSDKRREEWDRRLALMQLLCELAELVKRKARDIIDLREIAVSDGAAPVETSEVNAEIDEVESSGLEFQLHSTDPSHYLTMLSTWHESTDGGILSYFDRMFRLFLMALTGDPMIVRELDYLSNRGDTFVWYKYPLLLLSYLLRPLVEAMIWVPLYFARSKQRDLGRKINKGLNRTMFYSMDESISDTKCCGGKKYHVVRVVHNDPITPSTGFVEVLEKQMEEVETGTPSDISMSAIGGSRNDVMNRTNFAVRVYPGEIVNPPPVTTYERCYYNDSELLLYKERFVNGSVVSTSVFLYDEHGRKPRQQVDFNGGGIDVDKVRTSYLSDTIKISIDMDMPSENDSELSPVRVMQFNDRGYPIKAVVYKKFKNRPVFLLVSFEFEENMECSVKHNYSIFWRENVQDVSHDDSQSEKVVRLSSKCNWSDELPFFKLSLSFHSGTSFIDSVEFWRSPRADPITTEYIYRHIANPSMESFSLLRDGSIETKVKEETPVFISADPMRLIKCKPVLHFSVIDLFYPFPGWSKPTSNGKSKTFMKGGYDATRARTLVWSEWKQGNIEGILAQLWDVSILRKSPFLLSYWTMHDRANLVAARRFLISNEGKIAPKIHFAFAAYSHLVTRLSDLFMVSSGGGSHRQGSLIGGYEKSTSQKVADLDIRKMESADVDQIVDDCVKLDTGIYQASKTEEQMRFDEKSAMHVLGIDSGTWPADGGGVASCRRDVINRIKRVMWREVAEIGSPMKLVQGSYQIEKNVESLTFVPLWGTELGGPYQTIFSNVPYEALTSKISRTTPAAIQQYFVPVLVRLVDSFMGKMYKSQDELDRSTAIFLNMYVYFQYFDWQATWESVVTLESWRQSIIEYLQRDYEATRHTLYRAFSSELPTISDLDYCLSVLMHLLMPITVPVSEVLVSHASHHGIQALVGVIAKRLHNTSLVIWDHGVLWRERVLSLSDVSIFPLFVRNLLVDFTRLVVGVVFHNADMVLPVCKTNNPEWEERLGSHEGSNENTILMRRKISPVINGMEVDRFKVNRGSELQLPTAVMLSHVYDLKDIKTAIRAADFIVNKWGITDYRLDIYGALDKDIPYVDDCRAIIGNCGLANNVKLRGLGNAVKVLSSGWLLVNSSKSEGLPLALGEAGLAGLPVVCTDVGGSREVVSELVVSESKVNNVIEIGDSAKPSTETKLRVYGAVSPARQPVELAKAQLSVLGMLDGLLEESGYDSSKHAPITTDITTTTQFLHSLDSEAMMKRIYEVKEYRRMLGMQFRAYVIRSFGMARYLREHEEVLWISAYWSQLRRKK